VRLPLVVLALLTVTLSTAASQSWTSEVGIQGGYTRIKPAGTSTSDQIDLLGAPGDLFGLAPTNASLFVILPATRQLAIETSFGALKGDALSLFGNITFLTLGGRADVAIASNAYIAAGGTLNWAKINDRSDSRLGFQTAVGYRFRLRNGLQGRLEASALFMAKSDQLSPVNAYAVMLGISKSVHRGAVGSRSPEGRVSRQRKLGIQGGYSHAHAVGGADANSFALPGMGATFTLLSTPAGPPSIFAIFPITDRIDLEPGFDLHRLQSQGLTLFDANLSLRAIGALIGGVYAAAGGNLVFLKGSGTEAKTVPGGNLGVGYRFPITPTLGSRVELNYLMMQQDRDLGFPAINTVSVQVGVTLAMP